MDRSGDPMEIWGPHIYQIGRDTVQQEAAVASHNLLHLGSATMPYCLGNSLLLFLGIKKGKHVCLGTLSTMDIPNLNKDYFSLF